MSSEALKAKVAQILTRWDPPTEQQAERREEYLAHLHSTADPISRDASPHHFTCGGFVFDPTLEHVALVLHGKAKIWLQPGGHFESDDAGVVEAALREIREETGLEVSASRAQVVDLHHHQLSQAFGRCRSHRDIRVAAVLEGPADIVVSEESDAVRWWPVDALPDLTDPDLPNTITRIRDLLLADRPTASAAGRPRN